MSHEVETMMYTDEVPWHGLGTQLDEPPSIKEAIVASGLDWKVRKIQSEAKVNGHHVDIPGYHATVRERKFTSFERTIDGEPIEEFDSLPTKVQDKLKNLDGYKEESSEVEKHEILGVVGDRYRVLQNSEAFEAFEPLLEQGLKLDTAGSLFYGKRIWILAKAGDDIEITKGDPVSRYVLLSHGHDGKARINFGLTPTRVVCNNTLTIALQDGASKLLKFKHTKNSGEALKVASEALSMANQCFEATAEQYIVLAKASVGREAQKKLTEYVKLVLQPNTESSKGETQFDNLMSKLIQVWESAPGQKRKTWWDMYNVLTYYYSHMACRTQETRLESLWWGQNSVKNQLAMKVALELSKS